MTRNFAHSQAIKFLKTAKPGTHSAIYWLRTGIFDQASRKVGTMEIPLRSVKSLETAAK